MLEYLYYFSVIITIFFLFYIDGHKIVSNVIVNKYRRWRSLNNLVATRNSGCILISWISFTMICQAFYISLIQYLNNSVKKINRNSYEISYVINGKMYKMIVTPLRGPAPILQISNENQVDLTDEILPYLGPNYNWHHRQFYPHFFNSKTLIFELSDGTERTFSEEDHVKIE